MTVADIFDALTHERPYKKAWAVEEAIEEMKILSKKAFDPEVLHVFLKIQSNKSKTNEKTTESLDGTEI